MERPCWTKGSPSAFSSMQQSLPKSRINILQEALHFPLLILKESALAYNLAAMAEWCAANNFLIAPHGKTTMTPRIFERQIKAGAWGITVATASQAVICAETGIQRIVIANQVVGHANVRSLAAMMKTDPTLELLCLVDSAEGIEFLSSEWQAAGVSRPLGILVEMGRQGWRSGARSLGGRSAVMRGGLGSIRRLCASEASRALRDLRTRRTRRRKAGRQGNFWRTLRLWERLSRTCTRRAMSHFS